MRSAKWASVDNECQKARIAYLNQQAESAWFYLKATGVMLRVWCLRAVFSLCI